VDNNKQRRSLFRVTEVDDTDAECVDYVDVFDAFVRTTSY
jgi:hypothetical protein